MRMNQILSRDRVYNRIWFPYPEALIEAGIQAMDTHSLLPVRQEAANKWYTEHQQAFLEDLKARDINADAGMVQNGK